MAVLELSDESRALRDAARAWSAGSIAIEDYRMIRRLTLASMLGIEIDDDEATVAGSVREHSDDTETIEHLSPRAPAPERNDSRLLVIAGAIVVVGGVLALLLLV